MRPTKGAAPENGQEDFTPRRRKTKADYRAEITAAPPPNLPFLQKAVDSALSSGPCGIRQSQRLAINAAKRYMDDLCDHWRRDTRYLRDLMLNERESLRARARYARRWRPRFLAFLSVTDSPTLSARAAHVDQNTVYRHRERDPEFAAMWADACRIAIDLLEARVFQLAVEGNLEPVHYMGVVVDYVRKFDSKLQIELLRAKRPETFKTPGTNVNIGVKGDIFVLTEEQRHILMDVNRQWILNQPADEEPPAPSTLPATSDDNNQSEQ